MRPASRLPIPGLAWRPLSSPKRFTFHFVPILLARGSGLLILLLAGRAGYSQKIVPGYIVTAGQDSLRGAIVIHDDAAQQKQVDFITARGNQRQRLDAHQLKAYGYNTEKDTVRYVAVGMNLGRAGGQVERLFLRQLVAGPDELFRYHYSRDYYARPDRTGTEVSRPPSPPSMPLLLRTRN